MTDSMKYWVWLSSIENIGNRKKLRLLKMYGNPENLWKAPKSELIANKSIGFEIAAMLCDKDIRKMTEQHIEKMYQMGIGLVPLCDNRYPEYLKKIHDPPMALYYRGKLQNDELAIAVVGSRNATGYGLNMAENISHKLASRGFTVVSGMARGIDSYAHKGTLRADGRTIAVLGCGLDTIYPSENYELSEKILEKGLIISQFPIGVPPLPINFPMRNRIISGLSLGVVVVEANEKSGSLITANIALDQGKEVFAVPGNANSKTSIGTNRLIKDGAKLVMDIDDILEEIGLVCAANGKKIETDIYTGNVLKGLAGEERIIAEHLLNEELHIDVLSERSGFSAQLVNSVLVMMELKGIVEQLPGKIFRFIK